MASHGKACGTHTQHTPVTRHYRWADRRTFSFEGHSARKSRPSRLAAKADIVLKFSFSVSLECASKDTAHQSLGLLVIHESTPYTRVLMGSHYLSLIHEWLALRIVGTYHSERVPDAISAGET